MQNLKSVEQVIKHNFGKDPVISGNTVKVNVDEVNDDQILSLYGLRRLTEKVRLKRSGTGITIIITVL